MTIRVHHNKVMQNCVYSQVAHESCQMLFPESIRFSRTASRTCPHEMQCGFVCGCFRHSRLLTEIQAVCLLKYALVTRDKSGLSSSCRYGACSNASSGAQDQLYHHGAPNYRNNCFISTIHDFRNRMDYQEILIIPQSTDHLLNHGMLTTRNVRNIRISHTAFAIYT